MDVQNKWTAKTTNKLISELRVQARMETIALSAVKHVNKRQYQAYLFVFVLS